MSQATIQYDDKCVRQFLLASLIWGLVSMLVGVIAALQLNWWGFNGKFLETITFGLFKSEGVPYITFGRLRPLHTNAAIFAFVGNMMFAGVYYSLQRLCKVRLASDLLTRIHFWGWQAIILGAAITLPLGFTQSKEYAELIWPLDIAVALIWVVFAINFFWTIAKRNEPTLYVAIWFYIATVITVAMHYIVNNLQIPTSLTHGYPIFGGVQDALVQWWYGHNAVAFFLTTPILGIMYYFIPKAANRPVYSYRLSIIHFWSLVFIYIWAGPHHLLNTGLPPWLQYLGMFFSLMLWAPSWGGMLNGLLTLRSGWSQLVKDPVIKFFAAGVTFYGMATFEGPLLSIRAVNSLSHYSDWTIGHVHSGTLGWNGFMAAGMFYWLAPRLWRRKDDNDDNPTGSSGLWSVGLANLHFWIGLVGILLYVAAMWVSGITQGIMLNALNEDGTGPLYTDFVTTLDAIQVPMGIRAFGGALYLLGFVLCAVNIFMTIRNSVPSKSEATVDIIEKDKKDSIQWKEAFGSDVLAYVFIAMLFYIAWWFLPNYGNWAALFSALFFTYLGFKTFRKKSGIWANWHEKMLENYLPFTVLVLIGVVIGGGVQIIPTVVMNKDHNVEDRLQELYTPLELAGRDIYISEGCYNCHSQQIRQLVGDTVRYGDWSRLGESIYDHPFQWGSKRTGPDLAREGGKQPDAWQYGHLIDPRVYSRKSNMPSYKHLVDARTDFDSLYDKIRAQAMVGVPWPIMKKEEIEGHARDQGLEYAKNLVAAGVTVPGQETLEEAELEVFLSESEIVAVIAYLQKLGSYTVPEEPAPPKNRILSSPDNFRASRKSDTLETKSLTGNL
ncbi:MAG: cytochrome-c oxidase, cbb3-type subunit I [Verrucomicrobiota bacterium]